MFIKDSSGILSNTLLITVYCVSECMALPSYVTIIYFGASYVQQFWKWSKKSYINNLTLENIQSREIRKSIKIKLRCSAQRVKQKI